MQYYFPLSFSFASLTITLEAIPKHNGNIGSHLNGGTADLISAAHRKQPSDEQLMPAGRPASSPAGMNADYEALSQPALRAPANWKSAAHSLALD